MNRYVIDGILNDALNGKHIAVFSPVAAERRNTFETLAHKTADTASKIIRANGREEIQFHYGGRITIHTATHNSPRGWDLDIAVVHQWNDLPERTRETLRATTLARHGELIRI